MTTLETALERYRGWSAARAGQFYDFRESQLWRDGHMLYSDSHGPRWTSAGSVTSGQKPQQTSTPPKTAPRSSP